MMSSYCHQHNWHCPMLCMLIFFITYTASTSIFDSSSYEGVRGLEHEDSNLDCGMRRLFLEMAQQNVPWRKSTHDVFDALELGSRCNDVYAYDPNTNVESHGAASAVEKEEDDDDEHASFSVYVCPNKGNDKNTGSGTDPFATIHRALEETRTFASSNNRPKSIILCSGVHFLKETITLRAPLDNNLTIRSESSSLDDETTAWISGGFMIDSRRTNWAQSTNKNVWVAHLSPIMDDSMTSITGLFTTNPHTRMTLARYPNANVEEWNATGQYVPAIDKEKTATDDYEWIFPNASKVPEFRAIDLSQPNNPTGHLKNDSSMEHYNWYGTGEGGSCAQVWGNEPSYWCSNISAGGWAEVDRLAAEAGRPNIPVGVTIYDHALVKRFAKWKKGESEPRGAVFHVQHTQGWSWHMFNVSYVDFDSHPSHLTVHFDKGGSQGGRNWQCRDTINGKLSDCNGNNKKLHSGMWYVEGILAELDDDGEFYFEEKSKMLYIYHNPSTCDNPNGMPGTWTNSQHCIPDFIATNLKTLIEIQGDMKNPAKGIKLIGLGFRDSAKTYMEQWGVPSGGDWALYRGGAVHLDGTENVTISGCRFRRLDGNAIMISSYNRHAHVTRSDFSWIGDGAMATWGRTNGYDATEGNQPRLSVIERNIVSNIGLYQKQSSAWGQNVACQNKILNNVVFNVPRAAINFNDGLGGGNVIERNVIFNTCRESGDHGAINSWDRMPFLVDSDDGSSFTPKPTHTAHNLIMGNYNAAQGFDNDDGSSWYYTYRNVFFSAEGFKMDYGGHSSTFESNLVYGKECYGTGDFLNKNLADSFQNNICIMEEDRTSKSLVMGHLFQCSLEGLVPSKNSYYSRHGSGSFICGNSHLSLEDLQQIGFELGSTVDVTPSAETIILWARDILGGQNNNETKSSALAWAISILAAILLGVACYYWADTLHILFNVICLKIRSRAPSDENGEGPHSNSAFETKAFVGLN